MFKDWFGGLRVVAGGLGVVAGGGMLIYASFTGSPICATGGGLYFCLSVLLIIDAIKLIHEFGLLKVDFNKFAFIQSELSGLRQAMAIETLSHKALVTPQQINIALCAQIATVAESEIRLSKENTNMALQINALKTQVTKLNQTKKKHEKEIESIAHFAAKEQTKLNIMLRAAREQTILIETLKSDYEIQTINYRNALLRNSSLRNEQETLNLTVDKYKDALNSLVESTKCYLSNNSDCQQLFINSDDDIMNARNLSTLLK